MSDYDVEHRPVRQFLLNGRGECLELDDAIYCPRHARGRMSEGEWQLRWGNSIHPADAAHKPWGVTDE